MKKIKLITLAFLSLLIAAGCSNNHGRYQQKNDSTPTRLPNEFELRDAIPRAEEKSRGGNKHYQVRGKNYQVLHTADNFKQSGIASWYGKKFHGHLTSNGEIYNMYGMSAAHKNLPLPSYVKVTNNDNQKTVIVRVNDRGPFHQNRIIDLSYSAAYKLDMLKTGTANVTIEAITFNADNQPIIIVDNKISTGNYIQVFATRDKQIAEKTAKAITTLFQQPASHQKIHNIYKVQVGPFQDQASLEKVLNQLKTNGYSGAFRVSL
ncbi:septal ring lytic transglycosylase RlpA family protein [Thalassotalea castellviae]|uniref:Endolytic peptidoglycan transglycosylase RlpA n=1 Tax=Thalassotalea castellviae TaxID=3075612 RepID=A0ABU2ZXW2_9GAMM|nr:septal ring lytic transglycosylase RlpA family protein [Thalassotalea sp. W431]MDT0602749.1 septal ring lytic transglycosylase RlpA family protein [Thalassotalea sp. W431]